MGVVFELTPPKVRTATWQETTIYAFNEQRLGWQPHSTLLRDSSGALYGLLAAGGANGSGGIYKLNPPIGAKGTWTETLIYSFAKASESLEAIDAPVVMDKSGAIYSRDPYGGPRHNGTIIRLIPPRNGSRAWAATVLYAFSGSADGALPLGGLTMNADGSLFGTTTSSGSANAGTFFRLIPPRAGGTKWTHKVLLTFTGEDHVGSPSAPLVHGPGGVLFGASGSLPEGAVFELIPPKAGSTAWTDRALHVFSGRLDGGLPMSSPTVDSRGVLYGTTSEGSNKFPDGTVYEITP